MFSLKEKPNGREEETKKSENLNINTLEVN
jgi:hypothetical protein